MLAENGMDGNGLAPARTRSASTHDAASIVFDSCNPFRSPTDVSVSSPQLVFTSKKRKATDNSERRSSLVHKSRRASTETRPRQGGDALEPEQYGPITNIAHFLDTVDEQGDDTADSRRKHVTQACVQIGNHVSVMVGKGIDVQKLLALCPLLPNKLAKVLVVGDPEQSCSAACALFNLTGASEQCRDFLARDSPAMDTM